MIVVSSKGDLIGLTGRFVRGAVRGLHKLSEKTKLDIIRWFGIKRMDNLYASLIDAKWKGLTKEQHDEINLFWSKYTKVRHCSHAFYTQKTGAFYKEYIPDGIWRYVIDHYYNNWAIANYLDNKCYYHRMFNWGG